jgi:hypothetical protein
MKRAAGLLETLQRLLASQLSISAFTSATRCRRPRPGILQRLGNRPSCSSEHRPASPHLIEHVALRPTLAAGATGTGALLLRRRCWWHPWRCQDAQHVENLTAHARGELIWRSQLPHDCPRRAGALAGAVATGGLGTSLSRAVRSRRPAAMSLRKARCASALRARASIWRGVSAGAGVGAGFRAMAATGSPPRSASTCCTILPARASPALAARRMRALSAVRGSRPFRASQSLTNATAAMWRSYSADAAGSARLLRSRGAEPAHELRP